MKRLMMVFMALATLLVFSPNVSANEINHLNMDIKINEDGSVSVTETREADMTEGTENYIVFNDEDMGEVNVTDFSVEGFTEETDWDLDADLEEKAGKYGIVETDDGIELVWGIGDYSEQTYVVHYTLENAVRNLEDGQSLYWNFDTFTDLPTEHFTMNVTSAVPYDEDLQFWGFGFDGDINRENDSIVWNSEDSLSDDNDAVLLMHFPEGTYSTSVNESGTLEEEAEAAKDGSIYDDGNLSGWTIASLIGGIVSVTLIVFLVTMRFASKRSKAGDIASAGTIKRNNKGQETDMPPVIDDYASIAFVLKHLNMGHFEAIFQAYMMKWVDEGYITIEINRKEGQNLNKGTSEITILDYQNLEKDKRSFKEIGKSLKEREVEDDYEQLLWKMLMDAADDNGYIDGKSFKKWSKKNAKAVSTVADKLKEYSLSQLKKGGYFEFDKQKIFGIKVAIRIPTEKGTALLDHLVQYQNYLKEDYSRVYENDDYRHHMIWSVLVGEGKDIQKHLLKVGSKNSGVIPTTYMDYYYGPHLACQSWAQGLGQGGFSSSAASGSGGPTGAGGGAGAGGGGGGGAR